MHGTRLHGKLSRSGSQMFEKMNVDTSTSRCNMCSHRSLLCTSDSLAIPLS